ncbi:MAG: hypothetical protein ACOYKA_04545 [Legionellaceae bacterium]
MRLSLEEIRKILTESSAELLNDKAYLLTLFKNMKDLYLHSEGSDLSLVPDLEGLEIDKIKAIIFDFLKLMGPRLQDKMYSQSWLIERMRALGYEANPAGVCYGLSTMAMQAFLAHDMEIFNQRLQLIYDTPLERFKSERLQSTGEMVDILAFFDGIVLNQSPEPYVHLFSEEKKTLFQDSEKTMSLTLPLALDLAEKKPEKIGSLQGIFDKKRLASYLSFLKEHLGHDSFSLILNNVFHAVNLNYDSTNGRWLLVDPNDLPGVEYTHAELLTEAIMFDFGMGEIYMTSDIYTSSSPAKLDVLAFVCEYNDTLMIEIMLNLNQDMPSDEAFRQAIKNNNIQAIKLLMNKKCPSETSLLDAIHMNNKQAVQLLLTRVIPTDVSIKAAILTNDIEILLHFSMAGVSPTEAMLAEAVERDLMIPVYLFIQRVAPTEKIIEGAMSRYALKASSQTDNLDLIQLLLDHFEPTQETLKHACCHPDLLTLVLKKVKPTEETLRYAVEEGWGRSHPEVLTMLKAQMHPTCFHAIALKTHQFFKPEGKKRLDNTPDPVDTPSKRQ